MMVLRIAEIAIGLESDEPGLRLCGDESFRGFLTPDAAPEVRLRAFRRGSCPPAGNGRLFDSGAVWQVHGLEDGYHFRFAASCFGAEPYKTADFNAGFTSGEICLRSDCFRGNGPVYPMDYPLDELLVVNLLAQGRGVEVHGCGVRDGDGRGYLFLGQSGAGKSTMGRLWTSGAGSRAVADPPAGVPVPHIVGDDRIVLRFLDGRLRMYGTPWDSVAGTSGADSAPVDGVFFLKHGGENEMAAVAQPHAVSRLMACSFVPLYSATALDFTLAFLERVTRAVPPMELRFVPDARAVDFLRRKGPAND